MLMTPLHLQPMPKTQFDFTIPYALRDRCGRILGGSFTPLEGSEVLLRCNVHTTLLNALRTIRDTELSPADRRAVAADAIAAAGEA